MMQQEIDKRQARLRMLLSGIEQEGVSLAFQVSQAARYDGVLRTSLTNYQRRAFSVGGEFLHLIEQLDDKL